ncbi:ankyrin repeat domain-containing protein 9-like [Tachysurus fulvidraco]|uniref:ankyrin repeat domain-containing protein 9-like n=1 Tax=Tachysurus fulvidraco TaxID=1234273 RepID=UPI000F4E7E26|nr:ankyrin repeat domain-containing protein 9-like [Tachysurus fulvidraco]
MDGMYKGRKFLSFTQAVSAHVPVEMLEDMRKMKIVHWEAGSRPPTYTPSEALLYAIVLGHRAYAQYLLNKFLDGALVMRGENVYCCQSYVPHLDMAIRYNRKDIVPLILHVAHKFPPLPSYVIRGGCEHMKEGRTTLHLACVMSQPETVIMLLGSGASPQAKAGDGVTPLDLILEKLRTSKGNIRAKMCLERLLMFMPEVRFKMKSSLNNDPEYWSKVLGEEMFNYLVGRIPGTLFLIAMQKTLAQLPSHDFFERLDELPIPASLKPTTSQPLMRWNSY